MTMTRFMSFLLAGLEVAPHSPGSGRAFSWRFALLARVRDIDVGSLPWGVVIR